MTSNDSIVVEGEIHFADVTSPIRNATVYVRLVDMSLADAPSNVIAEEVIDNVSMEDQSQRAVPFSIRTSNLDERALYTLMVHVDVSGSGSVDLGDYVTMGTFPVSPTDPPGYMKVRVRPVK